MELGTDIALGKLLVSRVALSRAISPTDSLVAGIVSAILAYCHGLFLEKKEACRVVP